MALGERQTDSDVNAADTVEIYEGTTRLGVTVIENKTWRLPVVGLSRGIHTLEARTNGVVSAKWQLEVVAPLTIDTSVMQLKGLMVLTTLPLTGNDVEGTVSTRTPVGGVPPYTYTSSQPAIASVDTKGAVRSMKNGNAVITVQDAEGSKVTFPVAVSNVFNLVKRETWGDYGPAMEWVVSVGGKVITRAEVEKYHELISIKYQGLWVQKNKYWYGEDPRPQIPHGLVDPSSGTIKFLSNNTVHNYRAVAFVPT